MILDQPPPLTYFRQRLNLWKVYLPYALKKAFAGKNGHISRDQSMVATEYQAIYSPTNNEWVQERNSRRDLFRFRNTLLRTNGWFLTKAYNRLIGEAIRAFDARSVLEVGAGRGKNLVVQCLNHPQIQFTGLEYSANGVRNGDEFIRSVPVELARTAGFDSLSEAQRNGVARNLRFIQGSAFEMPFADKSFDVSFTCLVLEQMPADYAKAVREMVRVTRKACVFIEPFSEANDLLGRLYLEHKDYFRFSYRSFEQFGLKPVLFSDDLPQKMKFAAGILVAQII